MGPAHAPAPSRKAHVGSTWPLGSEHLELAARWLSEGRNAAWLDFGPVTETLGPLALKVMTQRDRHCIWVYGPREERRPAGLVALGNIHPRFRTAEAWFLLGEKRYGRMGLTTWAVGRLLGHGFGELGLRCIYAWTVEVNLGSRRILERLGFRFGGRLRASHRIAEQTYDRLWFDLLASEFNGSVQTWR